MKAQYITYKDFPTGVKYLIWLAAGLALIEILELSLFIIGLLGSLDNLSIIYTNIKPLLILIFYTAFACLMYYGLKERKYWGWIINIAFSLFTLVHDIIIKKFFFIPLAALYTWYLYNRYDFFKTGKLIKDEKFFKEEKIFKYLFWIFLVLYFVLSFYFEFY